MGILDLCWMTRIHPVARDERLSEYFPTLDRFVCIYVAGKQSPDEEALLRAGTVIARLYDYLGQIDMLDKSDWNLAAISFPYQTHGSIWYVEFVSEYDGQIAFSFHEHSERHCTIDPCIYRDHTAPQLSLLSQTVVEVLRDEHVFDPDFETLLNRIDAESVCGAAFIEPLRVLCERFAPAHPILERYSAELIAAQGIARSPQSSLVST